MLPVQIAITGNEIVPPDTPYGALVQFYRAFNQRDMHLMAENWATSDDGIAMDNPLGGIKRGWQEIGSVYERIFYGKAKVYVEYYDYAIAETAEMFCAVGRERGVLSVDGTKIDLAIRTSRIYRKIDGLWKQIHHHGSIDDPALLAAYQKAVMGK